MQAWLEELHAALKAPDVLAFNETYAARRADLKDVG
jgi:hypothetical protein